jgi:hypothetical protein
MGNTLGVYNPIFYAQEALIALHKALGMAGRVHRGYDAERRAFGKGQVISIKRPAVLTVGDAPQTAQDLTTGYVNLSLDYWREVKFKLTDQELSYTGEQIITDHIVPAAYALADDIDQKLVALYKDIPWFYDIAATPAVDDITGTYNVMFGNKVPLNDPANVHLMICGALQQGFQNLAAFSQNQGAGDVGVATQQRGTLGTKYGMEIFANQNVGVHTAGVGSDNAGTVTGAHLAGATTLVIGALTDAETIVKGDTLVIAGNTQRYAVQTTTVTVAANAATVTITPGLAAALSGTEVVTIRRDTHTANLAFHRNAFALAMAPLSEIGNQLGAKIATITDPVTGLSLRSRLYYVGNSSEVHVAIDVLYGVKTLDPNLACRACGA